MCGATETRSPSLSSQPAHNIETTRSEAQAGTGKPRKVLGATTRKKPGPKKKKGRKTKFTRETRRKIITHLRNGNSRRDAALLAGISTTLLCEWLDKGRENKGPVFAEFLKGVEAAEAQWREKLVRTVSAGAEEDPELALKTLRVRDPDTWAEKQKVDVHHGGDVKHHIILEDDD